MQVIQIVTLCNLSEQFSLTSYIFFIVIQKVNQLLWMQCPVDQSSFNILFKQSQIRFSTICLTLFSLLKISIIFFLHHLTYDLSNFVSSKIISKFSTLTYCTQCSVGEKRNSQRKNINNPKFQCTIHFLFQLIKK